MLDDLLEYHQTPEDSAFVSRVMQRLERQQRVRRLILLGTGTVGAIFGAAGAIMLSEPLARIPSSLDILPASLALVGGIAFFAWLFQDETAASG